MGLIFRANKDGSSDGNYVKNVVIQSAEVNLDFNQVYELVDGQIDNNNIAAGANIAASKLNLINAIGTAQLQDDAVTTLKIVDGAVTTDKLALNATTVAGSLIVGVPPSNFVATVAEVTLFDSSSFVCRGSYVLVQGVVTFYLRAAAHIFINRLTMRVYACNPTPSLRATVNLQGAFGTATPTDICQYPASIPIQVVDALTTPGDTVFYRVSVQAGLQTTSPLCEWATSDANPGYLVAVELA